MERPDHGAPRQSKNARSAKRPPDLPKWEAAPNPRSEIARASYEDPGHPLPRNPRERSWPKRGAVWVGRAERVSVGFWQMLILYFWQILLRDVMVWKGRDRRSGDSGCAVDGKWV